MTMDGDEMRRGNFFRRNQYKIAAICVLAAVLGVTGVYMLNRRETKEEPKQQVAIEQPKETPKTEVSQKEPKQEWQEEEQEETQKVSAVIHPKREDVIRKTDTDMAQAESETAEDGQEETLETAVVQNAPPAELHFNTEEGLLWPVSGAVILDYSMDQTVHFQTLDQYKYNPAVIIAGNVNDKVKAAADGKITDISTNEVTGCTVTMDIGDGYTAVYGQLKEVPYETGAFIEAGNTIGFVSEPTKYYSVEGSNLYFALEKDGVPVDPVEFFQ